MKDVKSILKQSNNYRTYNELKETGKHLVEESLQHDESTTCKGGFDYLLNQSKYDSQANGTSSKVTSPQQSNYSEGDGLPAFKTVSPGGALHTKMFDTILEAFEYLEGDGKDEPNFSIHEVSRLAINLHDLMVDNNVSTICGFKHEDTWSKEDLSIFIKNLFETLLDFLDGNEDTVSDQPETI